MTVKTLQKGISKSGVLDTAEKWWDPKNRSYAKEFYVIVEELPIAEIDAEQAQKALRNRLETEIGGYYGNLESASSALSMSSDDLQRYVKEFGIDVKKLKREVLRADLFLLKWDIDAISKDLTWLSRSIISADDVVRDIIKIYIDPASAGWYVAYTPEETRMAKILNGLELVSRASFKPVGDGEYQFLWRLIDREGNIVDLSSRVGDIRSVTGECIKSIYARSGAYLTGYTNKPEVMAIYKKYRSAPGAI